MTQTRGDEENTTPRPFCTKQGFEVMEKETVTIEGPGTTTVTASLKSYARGFVEEEETVDCDCETVDCACSPKKKKDK